MRAVLRPVLEQVLAVEQSGTRAVSGGGTRAGGGGAGRMVWDQRCHANLGTDSCAHAPSRTLVTRTGQNGGTGGPGSTELALGTFDTMGNASTLTLSTTTGITVNNNTGAVDRTRTCSRQWG